MQPDVFRGRCGSLDVLALIELNKMAKTTYLAEVLTKTERKNREIILKKTQKNHLLIHKTVPRNRQMF